MSREANNRMIRRRREERGQSLIVAVIVMFVLLFIGGVFIGLVARNLLNSGRAKDTLSAEGFARAGIEYARNNLEFSGDGADWRPGLTPPQNANDPDSLWLSDGYSRVEFRGGRALVKVTYQPGYADPLDPTKGLSALGKYLRIDAVGRVGDINPQDPTTYTTNPAPRLRRQYVAYKAIGITDYARFVTFRNGDTKEEADIGVPPLSVNLAAQFGKMQTRTIGGAPPNNTQIGSPGYSMRVNGNLRLMGELLLQLDPRLAESILVAGDIIPDGVAPQTVFNAATGASAPVFASSDKNFNTVAGVFRDASAVPDSTGHTRNISKLDPPLIDALDPATRSTRYRMLTRDSGWFVGPPGNQINTGRLGLGSGFYIDNFGNFERETQNNAIAGGQSLRSIWMKPGSTPNWIGPYYIPPGVSIEFGYPVVQDRDGSGNLIPGTFVSHPGFRVIRDASDRRFTDPNGNIAPAEIPFTFFIYKASGQRPVLKLDNEFFRSYLKTLNGGMTEAQVDALLPPFNGVIFTEGNARVRGLLADKLNIPIRQVAGDPDNLSAGQIRDAVNPPAITVVSDQTIYVDGSLVRENAASMIALLARQYIAVNPTLFIAPNKPMNFGTTSLNEEPPFHTDINVSEPSSTPPFALDFMFGDDPTLYTDTQSPVKAIDKAFLLLRHAAPAPPTYLDLLVNEAFHDPQFPGIFPNYKFRPNGGLIPPAIYPLDDPSAGQIAPIFEQRPFPLWPNDGSGNAASYQFFTNPGVKNTIRPAVDPDFTSQAGTQDYLFSRAAISPMDVRIEAVMYAENGSFFIIPGYSLNQNPADTRDAAVRRAQDPSLNLPAGTMVRPLGTADYYPFYGEPFDCRITIVGAISENRTASIADQAAWMQLWGYIPQVYGSRGSEPPGPNPNNEQWIPDQHLFVSECGMPVPAIDPRTANEKNGRITRGLRFLYDPYLHAPYPGYNPGNVIAPLVGANGSWKVNVNGVSRQDDHGRYLPPMPRLPVCPGYVFFGEIR